MSKIAPHKPKKPRSFVIGVRVDEELKTAIEAAAEKETRSLSQWMALAARIVLKHK